MYVRAHVCVYVETYIYIYNIHINNMNRCTYCYDYNPRIFVEMLLLEANTLYV